MKLFHSIKALYPLALAEGEGVGTAYEYFAKRLVLARLLAQIPAPGRILIAGLPEKYGASLDFVLLASELCAELVIVDDRPQAVDKAKLALETAQAQGRLLGIEPRYSVVYWGELSLEGPFDLGLSCEVLQRIPAEARSGFWRQVWDSCKAVALFVPNADNPAHTTLSGLSGLSMNEIDVLVADSAAASTGYIDMPPFPPGMTRSEEQREQATSGRFEALAMWILGYYARAERFLPAGLRRKQSHIVYALAWR